MDPDQYCRDLETYLCRKNDGHLVRIVGPSFDRVRAWAAQGIPFKVAARGIDRYFERYYAKGPRRRPVRIDFCEADVLDVFDEWRRAVGLAGRIPADVSDETGSAPEEPARAPRGPSLPAHLERVLVRLTMVRTRQDLDEAVQATIERVVRELDAGLSVARTLRGPARTQFVERLVTLDRELLDTAASVLAPDTRERLAREAADELAPFRARMAPDVYEDALDACRRRLVRQHWALPTLSL